MNEWMNECMMNIVAEKSNYKWKVAKKKMIGWRTGDFLIKTSQCQTLNAFYRIPKLFSIKT